MVSSRLAMSGALLLLMAASAWAEEPETMWFKDRLAGSAASKAKVADYYDKAEVAHQCLRLETVEKCRPYDNEAFCASGGVCPVSRYFETQLGCCDSKHNKHQDVFRGLGSEVKVGRCWWKVDFLNYAPTDTSTSAPPYQTGTYEVTCELAEHAEKCGEPLCEDLVLKGWGKVWEEYNAAVVKTQPEYDNLCRDASSTYPFRQAAQGKKPQGRSGARVVHQPAQQETPIEAMKPVDAKNPAKAASTDYYSKNTDPTFYSAQVQVLSGYVQVMSPSRKVTFKEGVMQAIGAAYIKTDENNQDIVITHPTNEFVAKPYTMHIALRKGGEY